MNAFLTRPIPTPGLDVLRGAGVQVHMRMDESPIPREALLEGVRGMDALLCMLTDGVDGAVLDAGPLKVVSNLAVGYNNIDVAAARARGIAVTNTPGVLTAATADLTWALLLSAARHIVAGDRMVREGHWNGWGPMLLLGGDLEGRTLGIVGAGRIGAAVARRARGFDMEVLVHDPVPHPEVGTPVGLEELLTRSDYVSLHCPLTPETYQLINESRLSLMKKTAWLINTARGTVVDEDALVRALQERRIAGAGLDVYAQEPRVHPGLLGLPNVVLAPHLGSATVQTRGTMSRIAAENLVAVLQGREPRFRVA